MFRNRTNLTVAASIALTASIALAGGAAAADLTVTGESDPTLQIALTDATAAFGTNLTPAGAASNAEGTANVDGSGSGACYEWAGSITVNSNVGYDVTITPAGANSKLNFLSANPADFAACAGGTEITASAITSFAQNQTLTASRGHDFWLGLEVLWTDAPSATRGDATLAFTVAADA